LKVNRSCALIINLAAGGKRMWLGYDGETGCPRGERSSDPQSK